MNQAPELIKTERLLDHPRNPRISLRDDVVAAISACLEDGFDPAHALIVRPVGDSYEIISGHHRKAAAIRSGLDVVPCWVRELDEDAAYMALATSNNQGELSPLEIGLHALHCVGLSEGGRGKKGGLSAYAVAIGKAYSTVAQLTAAARVAENSTVDRRVLHDKTQHLAAIHALPQECWPGAVEAMVGSGWSAKDTADRVKSAASGANPKRVLGLLTGATSERELARIDGLRDQVLESLEFDEPRSIWLEWFASADPIDVKSVQAKRIEVEDLDAGLRGKPEPEFLPSLVLADPPWRYDFSETDNRQIENQYPSATVDEIISHRPETQDDCVLLMWATVAKLREAFDVLDGWGFEYKTHAVWDKEKIGMGYWFRGQHELLLVGTKGSASPPPVEARVSSVFREARGKHSEKPRCVYEWIEQAFKDHTKLEMYCRAPRDGWLVFGNEARKAA